LIHVLNAAGNFIQQEKRRFVRVKVGKPVSVDAGDKKLRGTTLDLSLGGFSMQASGTLPVGSNVRCSIKLQSGAPPVEAEAKVVRVLGSDCMGLQFEKTGPCEILELEAFLLPLILDKGEVASRR
jgi:c-di-GMP-binding flagellar brake protein YcgR